MALRKIEGADLQTKYPMFVQVGMVVSLLLLIVAVRVDVGTGDTFEVTMEEQEVVDMKEIQQTEQEKEPPPPPKPPVPVEVPNDEVIEEQPDFTSDLDLDERLDTSQGPPASEDEEEDEDEIFVVVENDPECGGREALQDIVEYPSFARKAGIEGRVFVQFVVNEQGNVVNPRVTRGVHELLNKEALRAVKQLDCEPGQQRGEAVKVQMSLPVVFQLQ